MLLTGGLTPPGFATTSIISGMFEPGVDGTLVTSGIDEPGYVTRLMARGSTKGLRFHTDHVTKGSVWSITEPGFVGGGWCITTCITSGTGELWVRHRIDHQWHWRAGEGHRVDHRWYHQYGFRCRS